MNKKGQQGYGPMGMPDQGGSYAHPLLYLGIFIFVVPFLTPIIGWNAPRWISGIGVGVIILGAVLSIFRAGDI